MFDFECVERAGCAAGSSAVLDCALSNSCMRQAAAALLRLQTSGTQDVTSEFFLN